MNIKHKVNLSYLSNEEKQQLLFDLDTFWDNFLKDYQSNTHSKDGKRTRTPFKILSPTMGRSIMESYEGYSHRIGNSKYHR